MRRRLFLAATIVVALSFSAQAQMRGSHGGFSAGGSRGFASHGSAFAARGSFGHGSRFGGFSGARFGGFSGARVGGFGAGRFGNRAFFRHGHFPRDRFFFSASFGYPVFGYGYPYYGAYPYYPDPYYNSYPDPYYAPAAPAYSYGDDPAAQQTQAEVDRLRGEVADLRDEQAGMRQSLRDVPRPPDRVQRPPQEPVPAILVFRDRHVEEVKNYAIVGQTLWMFSEDRARKVPLSTLDIEDTTRRNQERGIDFRLPR